MPRLDFEEQFARQLKHRELKPSAKSWEKLGDRLEKQEKKSTVGYWWMGVAASIAAVFILFNFLTGGPKIGDSPVIVKSPETLEENPVNKEGGQIAAEEEAGTIPSRKREILPQAGRKESPVNAEVAVSNSNTPEEMESEITPQSSSEVVSEMGAEESLAMASELAKGTGISDAEINELLERAMAEVALEMGQERKVTDAEVDALLAEAMLEVRQEKDLIWKTSLSAEQLLADAESELEHSFRAQVFEILKDGLRKTRNAVANINE